MAKQAHNFAQLMKQVWEGNRYGNENAVEVALRQKAKKLRAVAWDGFINVPGDMLASLWQWPDGSDYMVLDDGSAIQAARNTGRPMK